MSKRPQRPRRRGFIILFGWRTITTPDLKPAVHATCPNCGKQDARFVGRMRWTWFTLMFVPVVPIQTPATAHRFSKCTSCGQLLDVPLDQLNRARGGNRSARGRKLADSFPLYNDLRAHPADGQRLLALLELYAELNEPAEADAAARHFPQAYASEPACAAVLERVRAQTATR